MIAMAIMEENKLLRKQNKEYILWRRKTPFMISMPNWFISIILFPMKTVLQKDWPETNKDIVVTLLIYSLLLLILSLPFFVINEELMTS